MIHGEVGNPAPALITIVSLGVGASALAAPPLSLNGAPLVFWSITFATSVAVACCSLRSRYGWWRN